jgi:hypothetical protein
MCWVERGVDTWLPERKSRDIVKVAGKRENGAAAGLVGACSLLSIRDCSLAFRANNARAGDASSLAAD